MKRLFLAAVLLASPARAQFATTTTTAPPGDSTTRIASTAFVQAAVPLAAITALTGDVVATGPGAVVATIQAGVVTAAKMAAGAAATNVGTLGGQLTGTLPNPSIASGAVTNSNLANMAAGTVKCNPTTSTGAPTDCSYPTINVKDYGATGNGSADDTTSIVNAIAALPLTGGDVIFPCGIYKVSGTGVPGINIGNGTSSTASTRYGVVLRGVGNSRVQPIFPGFNTAPCVRILWAGTGSAGVISVNGPLQTWGLQNMMIDCNSVASSVGLLVTSAQFGDSRNLTTVNCFRGINSTTVPLFGSFTNTDSFHNDFYGTSIQVPAISGAIGILLTGAASTTNTDYNTFVDTNIFLPTSVVTVFGIDLQVTDTDHFINTHIFGGNSSAQCVSFDYSVVNVFPSGVRFTGIDPGGLNCNGGGSFTAGGTPGAGAKVNQVYVDETNGALAGNYSSIVNAAFFGSHNIVTNAGGNVAGTDILGAWATFTPSLSCGTATFTLNSARSKTVGKITSLEIDFTITALGTCTNGGSPAFNFNLPATGNSSASIMGKDYSGTSGEIIGCFTLGSVSVACSKRAAANFVANERFILTGSYENQ